MNELAFVSFLNDKSINDKGFVMGKMSQYRACDDFEKIKIY